MKTPNVRVRRVPASATIITLAAAGILAAAAVGHAAPAALQCHVELITLAPSTATTGVEYGSTRCGALLGSGVQQDHFTIRPVSATAGTGGGHYRQYFDTGTIAGTFHLAFQATTSAIRYHGGATITSGTGAFSGARRSETLTCSSHDGGSRSSCTATIILTRA